MTYTIQVSGLDRVKRVLAADFEPTMSLALRGIATEIEATIKPYGRTGIWNSPQNPTGRWYERSFGPRWWVAGESGLSAGYSGKSAAGKRREVLKAVKRGAIHGKETSEQLLQSWHVRQVGRLAWAVNNRASYAPDLHVAGQQARWARQRGWVTDEQAIKVIVYSGRAQRIIGEAIMARLRRG